MPTARCKDYYTCLEITSEPINKAIAQIPEAGFKQIVKYRSGASSLFALNEIVFNVPHVFGFKPFSPFFETCNDVIGQSLASGFFIDWIKEIILTKRVEIGDVGPQVLTIDHLGLCFIACLIPLAVSFVTFVVELIIKYCVV